MHSLQVYFVHAVLSLVLSTALRSLLLHLPQLVSLDKSGKDTTVKSFKLEAKSARDNGDTQ
jgi:hypothetical protein